MGCISSHQHTIKPTIATHPESEQVQPAEPVEPAKPKLFSMRVQLHNLIAAHQQEVSSITPSVKKFHWVKQGDCFYKGFMEEKERNGYGYLYSPAQGKCLYGFFTQGMLERSHCYVFHEDGSVYKGPIDSKDQATGSGVLKTPYFTYTGSFQSSEFNGEGVQIQDRNERRGTFANGQLVKGVLETPEFKYEGEFKHGMMDGKGFYHWKNKGRYEGEFAQNLKHGKGKLYNTEGEFVKLAKFQYDRMIL